MRRADDVERGDDVRVRVHEGALNVTVVARKSRRDRHSSHVRAHRAPGGALAVAGDSLRRVPELGVRLPLRRRRLSAPADVAGQMDELRRGEVAGANVTVPWKRLALELADEVHASAQETGAANVLRRPGRTARAGSSRTTPTSPRSPRSSVAVAPARAPRRSSATVAPRSPPSSRVGASASSVSRSSLGSSRASPPRGPVRRRCGPRRDAARVAGRARSAASLRRASSRAT